MLVAARRDLCYFSDMNAPFRPEPQQRFTFDDVVRLSEKCCLPPEGRIELVDGRIEIVAPDGDLHTGAAQSLADFFNKWVYATPDLNAGWQVRAKATLKIDEYNMREPDLMVTARYSEIRVPRPADVVLLVETCVSSTVRDLKEKRRAYADAGIPEYWVWEAERAQALHVFRHPENGDYAEHQILRAGDSISPLFAAPIELAVDTLIPKQG
jgi:Uma2 family endonuclease